MHVGIGLDGHVFIDLNGPSPADASEVVALEINEHDVLGALLFTVAKRPNQRLILGVRGPPRPGPGDRPRRNAVPADLEQALRRRADHGKFAVAQQSREWARVGRTQARMNCGGVDTQQRFAAPAPRQVRLVDIARRDVIERSTHRRQKILRIVLDENERARRTDHRGALRLHVRFEPIQQVLAARFSDEPGAPRGAVADPRGRSTQRERNDWVAGRRQSEARFDLGSDLIAEIDEPSAAERQGSGHGLRSKRRPPALERVEKPAAGMRVGSRDRAVAAKTQALARADRQDVVGGPAGGRRRRAAFENPRIAIRERGD